MSTVTWRQLITEAADSLATHLGGERLHEARWIVERVSGFTQAELIISGADPVSTRGVAHFDQLVARRCAGEPLQYVLGRWMFRQLDLFVDARVLIPRPETEMVAGYGIDHLRTYGRPVRAADLGCGSGAIGLSVAVEVPTASVWLTDVSPDALDVTRANLAGLGRAGARVSVHSGSWFDALPAQLRGTLDLVISNPPYVAPEEVLPHEVIDYEPHVALYSDMTGGSPGDAHLVHLVDQVRQWLAPGGALVLEMSPHQTASIAQRCERLGFEARVETDLAGRPRAVVAVLRTG
jgi:release factor glutamine methyltransferase